MATKKKGEGGSKIQPGAILDAKRRAQLAQTKVNAMEIDFSDDDLNETPELLRLIDIVYFDRKSELQQFLKELAPQQMRLFLQSPFQRLTGGKHPVHHWWKISHYAARFNKLAILQELHKQGGDMWGQDGLNRTPLHYATEYKHGDVAKYLATRARILINLPDSFGITPLMLACQGATPVNISLCSDFLSMDGDPRAIQRFGYSALMYAVKHNCEENVRALLGARSDYNIHDNEMWTCLHLCAYYGFKEIASLLLTYGANVDMKNKDGATPLSIAAQEGKTAVATALISKRADVNSSDNYGFTPTMLSARGGHTTIVANLLKTGRVDLATVQQDGYDALMLAAQGKHTETVKLIADHLKLTEKVAKDTRYGNTALILAAHSGDPVAVGAILGTGADVKKLNDHGHSALLYAAESGDSETVRKLLDKGADKEEKRKDNGWTALMIAAWYGHMDVCHSLISYGADACVKDASRMNALHLAAYNNKKSVVVILLTAPKLRINSRDMHGFTALHLAVQFGHIAVAQVLLQAGANTEIWEKRGEYLPLHTAVRNNDTAMINLLMKHGANINGHQINGRTPAMFTVMVDNDALLQWLVDNHKADLAATDFNGNSALALSIELNATRCFRYLVFISSQLNMQMSTIESKTGFTPLLKAVALDRTEMTRGLVEAGRQPINTRDHLGRTPLYIACELANTDSIELLLKHAGDPGIANNKGETCLTALMGKKNPDALAMLLRKGASLLNVPDKRVNGQVPLVRSVLEGDSTMIKLLLDQPSTILDFPDDDGKTALMYSVEKEQQDVTYRLLKMGADSNAQDKNGFTPMHAACRIVDVEVIQWMADRQGKVSILDKSGMGALHVLAKKATSRIESTPLEERIEQCFRFFVKHYNKADKSNDTHDRNFNILNTPDGDGNTVMHILVTNKGPNLKLIGVTISLGASVNIQNNAGKNVPDSIYSVSRMIGQVGEAIETKWRIILKMLLTSCELEDDAIEAEISFIEYNNPGLESQQAQMMIERWMSRCQNKSNGADMGLAQLSQIVANLDLSAANALITNLTVGKQPIFRDSIVNAIGTALSQELSKR